MGRLSKEASLGVAALFALAALLAGRALERDEWQQVESAPQTNAGCESVAVDEAAGCAPEAQPSPLPVARSSD